MEDSSPRNPEAIRLQAIQAELLDAEQETRAFLTQIGTLIRLAPVDADPFRIESLAIHLDVAHQCFNDALKDYVAYLRSESQQ